MGVGQDQTQQMAMQMSPQILKLEVKMLHLFGVV